MNKQPLRIVFMGCPDFSVSCLKKLASDPDFEIAAVYSMPDRPKGRGKALTPTPVKACALELGLEVQTPATFKKSAAPEAVEILKAYAPDFLVVVAYGLILSQAVLDVPKIAAVNLHASLLPAYRGPSPIQQALLDGLSETGNTAMLMSRGMDEGDILAVQKTPVSPDDDLETLHDRLSAMGADFLCDTLKRYAAGEITPVAQDHSKATYTAKITTETAQINWNKPAESIFNQIRAMSPAPGAWFEDNGERIRVFKAAAVSGSGIPGTIMEQSPESSIVVACGANTALRIEELQRPGKNRLKCADFLRGRRLSSEILTSPVEN